MKKRKYIWFKENKWCRGLALAASQNVRALLLKENENLFEKIGSSGIYVKTEKVRFLCQAKPTLFQIFQMPWKRRQE